MKLKSWLLDTILCTGFILGVIFTFNNLPFEFEEINPISEALKDIEVTDIHFGSLVDRENVPADTNIVLVNIQHLDRKGIAKQISNLNKFNPKVIGIDAFFIRERSPDQDFPLMMSFAQTENLVLVSKLLNPNEDGSCFSELQHSHPDFQQYSRSGFANVITGEGDEGYRTVRDFRPYFCVADSTEPSFPLKIAQIFSPEKANSFLNRNNKYEVINWRGDFSKFYSIDAQDALDEDYDMSFVKDKIVLMGFLGDYLGDRNSLIDVFYTPLNDRMAGRAYPDMYGLTVHANVVSMILHENYIDQISEKLKLGLAIFMGIFNVFIFLYIAEKAKVYYDLITKSLQLIETILLLYLTVYFLNNYHIKVDMTWAIVVTLLSGDSTELYAGSVKDLSIQFYNWVASKIKS